MAWDVKQRRAPRRGAAGIPMESAFEDSKTYGLTELGSQFVHYTMTELVKQIGAGGEGQKK